MVHNGIEYGDMQLISEAYFLLTKYLCLSAAETSKVCDYSFLFIYNAIGELIELSRNFTFFCNCPKNLFFL